MIFSIFCSCKKEYKDLTTLEVKVYNKITGELIQDTLSFRTYHIQSKAELIGYNISQIVLHEQFLTGGQYSYSFNAKKDTKKITHEYSVIINADYQFQRYYGGGAGAELSINQHNQITLELHPYAYQKLKFKNMDCSVPTFFSFTEYHLEEPNFFNEGFTSYDGCTDFIQSDYSAWPMGNIHFEWHVTRNSITEIFHDTVYFDAGDSVIYEINY